MKLILASASPRRKELLAKTGLAFDIIPAKGEETITKTIPAEVVMELSLQKAREIAEQQTEDCIVIGADTLVFYNGEPLGKPRDEEDAVRILTLLSGTEHLVLTGVAVVHGGETVAAADTSVVRFRKLTKKEILRYVETGEPMDKAGAYGIQGKGGKLVESYTGNFDNIIGLPCALLASLIERAEKRYKMAKITQKLKEIYPSAECALKYGGDPWRLLVMGRLSAQCTDKRVNEVSVPLFEKYPTPEAMANADLAVLQELVRPCGLHMTKGKDLKESAALLLSRFEGKLPDKMEELLLFPGVGRKIANLLLGDVFGKPAVVTDTHFIRICGRLGAYPEEEKNPLKIERIMTPLLDPAESADFCHRIVWFGRDVCTARAPKCEVCPLSSLCSHANK